MNTLFSLIKRNIMLYLSSKSAVFFSLLASIITIFIFFIFLGKMNVDSFVNNNISVKDAKIFVSIWVLGGILSINSISIPQTVLSQIVSDRDSNTLSDFYVTPVKRRKLVSGYLLASIICATIINYIIFLFGELYLFISFDFYFSFLTNVLVIFYLIIFTFVYTSILFTLYMFVKNSNALGGISAFVSSIGGFLGGVYISIGSLSGMVKNIVSINPLAHTTSLMRILILKKQSNVIFANAPSNMIDEIYASLGVELYFNDYKLSQLFMFMSLFITFIIFYLISIYKSKHDKIK